MTDQSLLEGRRPILFLDGGLGTTLEEEHGVQFSSNQTPLWSSHLLVSSPQTLLKAQTDFVCAGAEILLTATYQASFEGFGRTPHESDAQVTTREGGGCVGYDRAEATTYMRRAVGIARAAFHDAGSTPGCVALSLGAYGASMVPSQEYTGKYSPAPLLHSQGLYAFHMDRIMCFAEDKETWGNVDLVAFETLPRLAEVRAVRMVMETVNARAGAGSRKEFWISCVFPDGCEGLPDGSSVADVVEAMLAESNANSTTARPFAIGINCTKVHRLRTLIQNFESASQEQNLELPRLVIYPDGASGLIYDTTAQTWVESVDANSSSNGNDTASTRSKPWHEEVAEIVREVQDRGAWKGIVVGGCCKTTPAHIKLLRRALG